MSIVYLESVVFRQKMHSINSFSFVSTPILRTNTRWKALDEIYKVHILLVILIFKFSRHNIFQKIVKIVKIKLEKLPHFVN